MIRIIGFGRNKSGQGYRGKDVPMFCPVCKNVELVMTERQGIEIDYCPTCRGVWLDRGELDKIIERSVESERGGAPSVRRDSSAATPHQFPSGHAEGHDGHRRDEHGLGHHDHRRSFWKDLFD